MKPDPHSLDVDETYELDRAAWNLPVPRPARLNAGLALEPPVADDAHDPAQVLREVDEAA